MMMGFVVTGTATRHRSSLANAFLLLIIGLCLLGSCFVSPTGLCQQYGHSCLGGHGKRDVKNHPPTWKYFFQQLMKYKNSQDLEKPLLSSSDQYVLYPLNRKQEDPEVEQFLRGVFEPQLSGAERNYLLSAPGDAEEK